MTDLPGPSRRRSVPLLAAFGVLAVVVVGVLLAAHQRDQPERLAVAPLPPASPGLVSAGYVGSHWRLTAVADGRGTTAIPASVDAWLELAADGEFLASDDVNTFNGRFTPTSAGFDVSDTVTTLVGYAGNDPVRLAAITGIGAMSFSPLAPSSTSSMLSTLSTLSTSSTSGAAGAASAASGASASSAANAASDVPEAAPAHITVLSADREHLLVHASGVRLTFVRSGPADRIDGGLPPATRSTNVD